jgi:hypothetical protein
LIEVKLGQKGFKQERRRFVEFSSLLCKRRALNQRESDPRTRHGFSLEIASYTRLFVDRLWRAMDWLDSFECASSTSWDGIVVVSVSDWVLL